MKRIIIQHSINQKTNKQYWFFYIPFLIGLLLPYSIFSQDLTKGSGREFYLTSFSQCSDPEPVGVPDSVILYIVGIENCSGYAENTYAGYYLNFTVTPNQVTELRIPASVVQCADNEGIQHKAIYLNTTKDVWVYMQTSTKHCEGTLATSGTGYASSGLIGSSKIPISPIQHFNDEILVYNNTNAGYVLTFIESIIATEDNTIITIPDVYPYFSAQIVHLNKGEMYNYIVPWQVFSPEYGCVHGISSNCKTIIGFQHWVIDDSVGRVALYINSYTEQNNYAQFFSKEFLFFWHNPYTEFFRVNPYDFFTPFSLNQNISYTLNVPFWYEPVDCLNFLGSSNSATDSISYIIANAPFTLVGTTGFIMSYSSYFWGFIHYPIPTDRMVNEALFASRMQPSPHTDTLITELTIITTNAGRWNTLLNNTLIPFNSFHPIVNCPYYYTQFVYNNNAPEILHIKNPDGFVASMNQFGYYDDNFTSYYNGDTLTFPYRYLTMLGMCHSGGNGDMKASLDGLDFSPVRCSNDTLHLHILNNWFHHPISWIIGDNYYPNQEAVEFPLVDSGWLEITLIIGKPECPDTVTKRVYVVIPPILVNMPNDTMICPGEYITIHSPNTDRFTWSDGTESSRLYPRETGIYTLTARNYCYSVDSSVYIEILDCDNDIYIPNAFTPEGNGLNEVFKPVFTQEAMLEEYKFYIYNRWGNLIYYTTDIYDGWTGYGSQEGVYVYVVEYKNRHERGKVVKGTVMLVR